MIFRGLKPDEIEIRVGSVSEKGATLLFFKNARVDMAVLDEAVGEAHWQRDHKEIKGNLYCGIGIRACAIDDKVTIPDEWIWKWDCGTESYTEKEKGESSDSFKRAGFNWGIGRELYTAPFTFVKCKTVQKGDYKYELEDKYQFSGAFVSEIEYNEDFTARKISKVTVCDKKGNAIFKWDSKRTAEELSKVEKITKGGIDFLENMIAETGADLPLLLKYYGVKDLSEMSVEQFDDCVKILKARLNEPKN